jgi:hypothetical protein
MNYTLKIIAAVIIMSFSVQLCIAQAEYDSLPLLDGRIDRPSIKASMSDNSNYSQDSPDLLPEKTAFTEKAPSINKPQPQKNINILPDNEPGITTIDSPQLDLRSPRLSLPQRTDTLAFIKYQEDLNKMISELTDLKKAIKEGVDIQVYSAKATNAVILNDIFSRKYNDRPQSNYETYKLVQQTVNLAKASRDYWINSNKIKYNLQNIPDRVIETNFLRITTNVDKLIELSEIDKSLTDE